jgi:uncharacterized membrane protein (UPF0127 family)
MTVVRGCGPLPIDNPRHTLPTTMTRLPTRLALFLITTLWGITGHAQDGPQKLAAIRLSAGMHVIQAELAQSPEERTIGLMFRKTMATSDGMLFAFEQAGQQCFWMKNTLLPLSAAFVADDGTVVNIEDMKPQTLDGHCSSKPVRFVLEMNAGWFAKRGIKPGSKLQGTPFGK